MLYINRIDFITTWKVTVQILNSWTPQSMKLECDSTERDGPQLLPPPNASNRPLYGLRDFSTCAIQSALAKQDLTDLEAYMEPYGREFETWGVRAQARKVDAHIEWPQLCVSLDSLPVVENNQRTTKGGPKSSLPKGRGSFIKRYKVCALFNFF